MKITQLSVFVENAPGHILAPCRALADAGVNIRALSLADAQKFGILRMIVSDWRQAATSLKRQASRPKRPRCWPWRFPTIPADCLRCWERCRDHPSTSSTCTPFPSAEEKKLLLFSASIILMLRSPNCSRPASVSFGVANSKKNRTAVSNRPARIPEMRSRLLCCKAADDAPLRVRERERRSSRP